MNLQFNISRKYEINGKVYKSLEEMPPEARAVVEASAKLKTDHASEVSTGSFSTISVNGVKYGSVEEMPPEVRELYESIRQAARADADQASVRPAGQPLVQGNLGAGPEMTPRPIQTERSVVARSLVLSALVVGGLVLLYYIVKHLRG